MKKTHRNGRVNRERREKALYNVGTRNMREMREGIERASACIGFTAEKNFGPEVGLDLVKVPSRGTEKKCNIDKRRMRSEEVEVHKRAVSFLDPFVIAVAEFEIW